MPGDAYRWTPRSTERKRRWFDKSRILLTSGCVLCFFALLTSIFAVSLPYWVYVTATVETTVAGLTDATEVTYFYGLTKYCLKMTATHLDIDECGEKPLNSLESWERLTFVMLVTGLALLLVTMVTVLLNFFCWNKLFFLINATFTAVCSGVCTSVGVSIYQIEATVQVLNIGGLATAKFRPEYLHLSFWFGFTSALLTILASFLFMFGAFTWKKPEEPRMVLGGKYKTTVKPQRCPYKGRQPAIISVTQM